MIAVNSDLKIWSTRPLMFTGVKKVQNLAFDALWFRNEATYRLLGRPM